MWRSKAAEQERLIGHPLNGPQWHGFTGIDRVAAVLGGLLAGWYAVAMQ
jgi:hypothetical protein